MIKKSLIILFCFLMLIITSVADVLNQDFETWPTGGLTHGPQLHDGWTLNDGKVSDVLPAHSGSEAGWLINDVNTPGYTNSYLLLPELTNGIGTLSFYVKLKLAGSSEYQIQTSTDKANWDVVKTLVCNNNTAYSGVSVVLNITHPVYVRIYKSEETSGRLWLGIDDVTTTDPPAMVKITNPALNPAAPVADDAVEFFCTLTPEAGASNIIARLSYSIGSGPYTTINMVTNGLSNGWVTDGKIPGQSAGTKVNYYLTVIFDGYNALSPTNYPGGGSSSPNSYIVKSREFISDYKYMNVIGSLSSSMMLISDRYWQTIVDNSSSIANADIRFSGITTNLTITNFWGDSSQVSASLPIYSTAVSNDTAINIGTFPVGQAVFRFNESSLNYLIRQAYYQSFDSWPDVPDYGDSSYSGWSAVNAIIETPADTNLQLRGKTCILNSNNLSWIQSPYLTNGIGEINFWFRNASTNGAPTTDCYIQFSETGGTNLSEWTTVDTISDIDTVAYRKYVLSTNNYTHHYVRILSGSTNSSGAALCIDELMIMHGGAAVSMTNLVATPAEPTAADPIDVSIDVLPLVNASNLQATLHYRSGLFGAFTDIPMSNTVGNTYQAVNPIPAGSGDDNGAGTVQYYVSVAFDGLDSEMISPMTYPVGSPDTPASIVIKSATIEVVDVCNSPDPVYVNDPITIHAVITPSNGTIKISPSVWYRAGNEGSFTEIPMDYNGTFTNFITTLPIPAQTTPGDYVQYYLAIDYVGPGAESPTNYPATGYLTIPVNAKAPTSSFQNFSVTGALNTNLSLIDNDVWFGVAKSTTNIVDGGFLFKGELGGTPQLFGDNNQLFTNMPVFDVADTSSNNIVMGGTNGGYFAFRFNVAGYKYYAQLCDYVNFSGFVNSDSSFASYTNSDGWVIENARTTSASETNLAYSGVSCLLNSNGVVSYAKSPYLVNGIGEISFWYRNAMMPPDAVVGKLYVQKSIDGINNWETMATIDDVRNFNYLHYSGFFYYPGYHYVRIINATDGVSGALLLLDDVVVSHAGPGVTFSNLHNTPQQPEVPEAVDVSVDIDPVHYASDINATLWYRFGTNGNFDSIHMNKGSSNTYTTVTSIPRGYDGTVEYYVEADFLGVVQSTRTYSTAPAGGAVNPTNYLSSGNSSMYEDFNDWDTTGTIGVTVTNNGWIMVDSLIRNHLYDNTIPATMTNTLWLTSRGDRNEDSYLQSPESSYGIGSVSFYCKWRKSSTVPTNYPLEILFSDDGINWTFATNVNCDTSTELEYRMLTFDNPTARYIRIHKTSISSNNVDYIGIENVLITYPAAKATISDVTVTPPYPDESTPAVVSCKITSGNSSFPIANVSAKLHYKAEGDTNYSVVDMTGNGNVYTSAEIPPIAAGKLLEYYITTEFAGYHGSESDNRSPSYYPTGDIGKTADRYYTPPTNNPAAFLERQEYLAAQNSIDTWTNGASPGTWFNNGWKFNEAQGAKLDADTWFSTPYAAELLNDGSYFDSYIESPVISNGVGTLSFYTRNRKDGDIELQILASTNGNDFTTIGIVTSSSSSNWVKQSVEINYTADTILRIRKGGATGDGYTVLIDNLEVSYMPSTVEFSNIVLDPGYPAANQNVYLTCTILPENNQFEAASDISADLYYRNITKGETTFTGPVSMIKNGDKYRTFAPIPSTENGLRDIIEYYVEANFNGYYYKPDNSSRSPSFYPTGNVGDSSLHYYTPPVDSAASYQVRPYISDYDNISVVISNLNVTMTQKSDHEWNGFVFIDQDMPDTRLWLNGNGFFDGTNYSGTPIVWSDTNQWKTSLPFAGNMTEDNSGTVLYSPERGAYLIRFNDQSGGYIIQRAAFQDFNIWPANPDYFEASFSQAKVTSYTENFDYWTPTVYEEYPDDFNSWTVTNEYYSENEAGGSAFWLVSQARIIDQMVVTNATRTKANACQLYPADNFGNIKTIDNSIHGTGKMTLEYRCVDDAFAPSLYQDSINWDSSMIEGNFVATTLPKTQDNNVYGSNIWISFVARYVDDRNYYELRREQISIDSHVTKQTVYSIYKMKNGNLTRLYHSAPQLYALNSNKKMGLYISTYDKDDTPKVLLTAYEDDKKIQFYNEASPPTAVSLAIDTSDPITMQGRIGIRVNGVDAAADNLLTGSGQQVSFLGWPAKSNVTTPYTKDDWTINYAESVVANSYVELMKNNATGEPVLISPLMEHGIGSISLRAKARSGNCRLIAEWSDDQTTWHNITSKDINNTSFADVNLGMVIDVNTPNVYLRLRNDKSLANNGYLSIDDVRIQPSPTLAPNFNFANNTADGWFATYGNWLASGGTYNGKGIVNPISFTFEIAPDYAPNDWRTITNIVAQDNINYKTVSVNYNVADPFIPRVRHTYGDASLVVNSINITDWHGHFCTGTNGWKAQAGWVRSGGMATNALEMRTSRARQGEPQFLLSPRMTNGVGTISFNYIRVGNDPVSLIVESAPETNQVWVPITTITNSVQSWDDPASLFVYNIRTNESMFVRVRNVSTTNNGADAVVLFDNAYISDFSAKDDFTWTAYNALITGKETDKLWNRAGNIKGGYLNDSVSNNVAPLQVPLNEDKPYIQSGYLKDGIGEISFWYRAWDSNTKPTLRIKLAPTKETPANEWTELTSLPEISTTEFIQYQTAIYDTDNHYVRFYNDTSATDAGRICLEDIIITAPFGADVIMQGISISPQIPLKDDPVYITADVARTFLNPSNITLTAYWRSGTTNNWGTWKHDNPLPMEFIGDSEKEPLGKWRTISPIPAQPVDTLVQYYVEASFEGVFSDRASPKDERGFTNPDWYYPVNLNSGTVNTNPYYYVFSCMPGRVWLNEINLIDGLFSGIPTTQYIEVAGISGADISKWKISVFDNRFVTQDVYSVTDGTILPNHQDGYGFWIVGDSNMGNNADMYLTNELPTDSGGIRLYRSMGALEDGIAFGDQTMTNDPNNRLVFVGYDDNFFNANPVSLIGTGSNRTDFASRANWVNNKQFTPMAMNDGQTLVNGSAPVIQIQITGISEHGSQIWLVFNTDATYDIQPTPWVSTNLLNSSGWTQATGVTYEYNNGIYTQKFDKVSSPVQFYKVTGINQ